MHDWKGAAVRLIPPSERRIMAAPRCVVLVHVYYPELWNEIARYLRNLDGSDFDLYVNAVEGRTTAEWARDVARDFPGTRVHYSPNRGQDIGGTINLLGHVDLSRYDWVCKLHTKRSPYDSLGGDNWRVALVRACLHDVGEVLDLLASRPDVSMVGCREWMTPYDGGTGDPNYRHFVRLCRRLRLDPRRFIGPYLAGTMFWCRSAVMQALKDVGLRQEEFHEGYARDGTLAHAMERVFTALARSVGNVYWR